MAACGPPDAHRIEDGRLDDHVGRRLRDLGCRAAHHTGDGERAVEARDEERLRIQVALHVIQRLESLAGRRPADHDRRPSVRPGGHRGGIERVDGLAQLQHHVVRGVDDVRDGPHPGGEQPHLDAIRGWPDGHPADPAPHEPGAQLGVPDVDGQPLGGGRAVAFANHDLISLRQRPAGRGGHLARQSQDRQRIAAIGLDVDIEHHVAVQLGERHAERRVVGQDQDPVAVGGQVQLLPRAQHPVAHHAHLLGALDPSVTRQDRARQRDRDPLARGDVGRPAHDRQRLAPVAKGDGGQRQPVGPRVLVDREQLAGHDLLPVGAPPFDLLDLHAQQRQPFGELLRREVDVDELAQPGHRDPHRKAARNRRSFSVYSRRSPTAWRRFAIRSTPIPNANPW